MMKNVNAGVLRVSYMEEGASHGIPVLLLHGFPYDVHSYDEVTPLLVAEKCRVITPYLRGFGPTQFLGEDTLRSGQQAALAYDLLALMDALSISKATLAGYDWGGRAACIVAALWPERVTGLVSCCGYNIHNIPDSINPEPPENEFRYWYQYYFHSERGRAGLDQNRYEFCKLLWQLWSPNWRFNETTYQQTARSFDNRDFVEVVIHSYRHRFGLVDGDPSLEKMEQQLAAQPRISVPSIVLHGEADGVIPVERSKYHDQFFTSNYQRRVIALAGHNLPQEAPSDFAKAVLSLV
jgi:pimeloyl-ACP methyl ester carboxylesterase